MTAPLILTGFWSYTRDDDSDADGRLTRLREMLAAELRNQIGGSHEVHILHDVTAIPPGASREQAINAALDRSSFLIPIVTPSFLHDEWCRKTLLRFRQRETVLGRDDLIFPLKYIDTSSIAAAWPDAADGGAAVALLNARPSVDFTGSRLDDSNASAVALRITELATRIRLELQRDPPVTGVAAAGTGKVESAAAKPSSVPHAVDPPSHAQGRLIEPARTQGAMTDPVRAQGATTEPVRAQGATTEPVHAQGATTEQGAAGTGTGRGWLAYAREIAIIVVAAITVGVPIWVTGTWFRPIPFPADQFAPANRTAATTMQRSSVSSPAPAALSEPWATNLADQGAAPTAGSELKECAVCPVIVLLPPGRFTMGATQQEDAAENVPKWSSGRSGPTRIVSFDQPFYMGKYPVTRRQFAAFVREAGERPIGDGCWTYEPGKTEKWSRELRKERSWRDPGFEPQTDQDQHPVVCVNYDDARDYAAWLRDKTGGKLYALPSETQWEYAARAARPGTAEASPRYWGAASACVHANGADASLARLVDGKVEDAARFFQCDDRFPFTSPVGQFMPNAFHLHDMLGNVWQWTEDCWNPNYKGYPPVDGAPWPTGDCARRALRGGSWISMPRMIRAAARDGDRTGARSSDTGFRVVRTLLVP